MEYAAYNWISVKRRHQLTTDATRPDVIGYVRCSTDDQDASIETQRYRITKHCSDKNLNLIGIYEDVNVSGTVPLDKRKAFSHLLARVASGEASTIVICKLDRLTRNARDFKNVTHEFKERSILILCLDMPIDIRNRHSMMMASFVAEFAEQERDNIRERVADGFERKRQKFECLGTSPYG
jgi:DNA invertase Pin-like site-specific DNA recombinase